MSRQTMLVMVDTIDNNNKFYELTELSDGRVQARYGRIGATEQTRVYPPGNFDKKLNEKLRKGYVRRDTAAVVPSNVTGIEAADRVNKALFNGHADAASRKFAEMLLRTNRHAIEDATGGKIMVNKDSGAVTTALGPVTQNQLSEARVLLAELAGGSRNRRAIEKYLTIIPQRIANVRTTDWMTGSWVKSQEDLLDALAAALASTSDDDDDPTTDAPPIPFRNKLELVDVNSDEFAAVDKRFRGSMNSIHASSTRKLVRVWKVVDTKRDDWDKSKAKLKHTRTLWHGTTAGNVLSILRTGLICPPSSDGRYATTGRMFGDGVYFSDQSTKSLNYAIGAAPGQYGRSGDGATMMFLADVVMGREYRPTTYVNVAREARTGKDSKGRPYNSIFVRGGTSGVRNNEMIVWNTEQITLTYLCEFN